jgi:hypothetical protein
MKPTVYTYFESGIDMPENQENLLRLWRQSWSNIGWNPVILGPKEAKMHLSYPAVMKHIGKLKPANHPDYERACWIRWLALDVAGGGLMTDYDVINQNLVGAEYLVYPNSSGRMPSYAGAARTLVCLDRTGCPCAVFASEGGCEKIINRICEYHPSGRWASEQDQDMFFDWKSEGTLTCVDVVAEYKDADRRLYPLIHFKYSSCQGMGLPSKAYAIHLAGLDQSVERKEFVER